MYKFKRFLFLFALIISYGIFQTKSSAQQIEHEKSRPSQRPLVFHGSLGWGYTFSASDGNSFELAGGATYFLTPSWGIGFAPEINTLGNLILPVVLAYRSEPGWLFTTYTSLGIGWALGNNSGLAYVFEGSLNFPIAPNMELFIGPKFVVTGQKEASNKSMFILGLHSGLRF